MMTLEEKERKLIEDINLFNYNIEWWESEIKKTNKELNKLQKDNLLGLQDEEINKLVAKLTYLAGKARTEQKASRNIEKNIYRLQLEKDLEMIQGNHKNHNCKKPKNKNFEM